MAEQWELSPAELTALLLPEIKKTIVSFYFLFISGDQ